MLLSELLINPAYQEIPIIIVLNKCDQEASINTSLFKNFLPVDALREVLLFMIIIIRILKLWSVVL